MKKTALFFGSFNPVHVGHMVIANHVVEYGGVDKLWFVVSPHNPLKAKNSLIAAHHRIEMLRLAIGDDIRFRVSDIETRLPTPSYTVTTLAHLGEKHPDHQFCLLMGGDNLATFGKWKNHEHILANYEVLVYARPEVGETPFDKHPSVRFIDAPKMAISSTTIREMVTDRRDARHFMPKDAWKYLDEMNLYE